MIRQILNKRGIEPGDWVYVGRGTFLGNPYRIGPDGDRDTVIRKYRIWFSEQWKKPTFRARVRNYVRTPSTALVCYCAPEPCHAEVIREFVDGK